jgi:hypothetical protein
MTLADSSTMYDVIGDIHGRFDKFRALMKALGYAERSGTFLPPQGRQAIFVGDLIDRGPEQIPLLKSVRSMIDAGHARAVMGNHELNAIAFVTRNPEHPTGEFLRVNAADSPKCAQNRRQHAAFLAQVGEGSEEHLAWVRWFRSLPLHLDLGGIRVAHAWWHAESAALLDHLSHRDADGLLTDAFLVESHRRGSALKRARKIVTTGFEQKLPKGTFVTDGEGNKHDNVRLKIWKDDATHLHDIAIVPGGDLSCLPNLPLSEVLPEPIAPVTGSPILLGHYWFAGSILKETPKVAVLDWSAAKSGPLVAYRWDGESHLSDNKFVAVNV